MTKEYYDKGLGGGRNTLEAKHFWEAMQDGRLLIQQCQDCGEHIYPPQDVCAYCWSDDLEWTDSSGLGRLHTYSTIHVDVHSTWADEIPYIVAFVELKEGPYIATALVDCEPDDVELEMPVEVTFREVPAEEGLFPLFRPREEVDEDTH